MDTGAPALIRDLARIAAASAGLCAHERFESRATSAAMVMIPLIFI
jgi:hypothetical protein